MGNSYSNAFLAEACAATILRPKVHYLVSGCINEEL